MFVFLKASKILLVPMAKIFVNQGSINYALLQSWIGEHGESLENMENMENINHVWRFPNAKHQAQHRALLSRST